MCVNYISMNMDSNILEMIEKQVKFLYGYFYEKSINKETIFIKKNTEKFNLIDFSSNELFNLKTSDGTECSVFVKNNNYLPKEVIDFVEDKIKEEKYGGHSPIDIIKDILLYYEYKENVIFRFNLHDGPFVSLPGENIENRFYIGHNRSTDEESLNKPLLYPMNWHIPSQPPMCNTIVSKDKSFDDKENKVIFRGANNGRKNIPKKKNMTQTIRELVVSDYFEKYNNIDIAFTPGGQASFDTSPDGKKNYNYYKENYTKEKLPFKELLNYKFILCLGGNDWSSAFPYVANSNSCPIHTHPIDWVDYYFGQGLEANKHYVPFDFEKNDDLKDKMDWCLSNLDICKKITDNGIEYTKFFSNQEILNEVIKRIWKLYPVVKYED